MLERKASSLRGRDRRDKSQGSAKVVDRQSKTSSAAEQKQLKGRVMAADVAKQTQPEGNAQPLCKR